LNRRNMCGDAGFTLVEVIVALAMMSAGLTILLSMMSSGLAHVASAQKMAEAGALARSLMARVGTEFAIKAGQRDGEYPDGYRWHLKLLPYGDGKDAGDSPVALYTVSAEIEWNDHDATRSYKLDTLRLGPRVLQR